MENPAIAFKEWAVICDALADGKQSLIVRKGGIAEGRDGFRFAHPEFYLFPTRFHEQVSHTRLPSDTPLPQESAEIVISIFAVIEKAMLMEDWNAVCRLEPFHLWTRETIRQRFDYDEPAGVNVAVVRVFRLAEPLKLPDAPAFGGCRSWVKIPVEARAKMIPVISDIEHAQRTKELDAALAMSNSAA